MAVTLETVARDAACNAIVDQLDGGALEFKTSEGTSVKGNGEVATLTFGTPAFDAAGSAGGNAAGVATAEAITSDTSAAGGTTTKAYFYTSANAPVLSCAVGTSGSDINLSSTTIGANDTVAVSALTFTIPAS